jgi:hypothetical protein
MPKVHEFGSTGEACAASQTDEQIADGDVLLVRSEHAMAVVCEVGPVAVDGFTGRAFPTHDETWDWSAAKQVTGNGYAVRNYSESATLARRAGQKAGVRKGVVYRASNGDPEQVYEARADGLDALCVAVRTLSKRAGGSGYRIEDIRDGKTVAVFLYGEQIAGVELS